MAIELQAKQVQVLTLLASIWQVHKYQSCLQQTILQFSLSSQVLQGNLMLLWLNKDRSHFSFSIYYSLVIQQFDAKQSCCLTTAKWAYTFQWGTAQVASTYILILLTYSCDNLFNSSYALLLKILFRDGDKLLVTVLLHCCLHVRYRNVGLNDQ